MCVCHSKRSRQGILLIILFSFYLCCSEKCLLDCGANGVCDNSEVTMRCQCPFGKSGNKCENGKCGKF